MYDRVVDAEQAVFREYDARPLDVHAVEQGRKRLGLYERVHELLGGTDLIGEDPADARLEQVRYSRLEKLVRRGVVAAGTVECEERPYSVKVDARRVENFLESAARIRILRRKQ
jgi:hypothetical protein